MEKQQIVSLSGGKDSTEMLHQMIEHGEAIEAVVFVDTGWEFPEMHDHINLVEKKTGIKESFLQGRTVCMNYKAIRHIILQRRNHKLPQWKQFVNEMMSQLQYPEYLGV